MFRRRTHRHSGRLRRGRRAVGSAAENCLDVCGSGCGDLDCLCDGLDLFTLLGVVGLVSALTKPIPDASRAPGGFATRCLWRLVRAYQVHVSAPRPACCPQTPTCSRYALEALTAHGAVRGSWLTARRLVRCRPDGPRGLDPVPTP